MKRQLIQTIALLAFAAAIALSTPAQAGPDNNGNSYTLAELAVQLDEVQKKEVVLNARIIGSCKSGCKMWVADGDYKEGDLFVLVRAKDDAFKFDTKAAGKSVKLHGFAVARLIDTCGEKDDKEAEGDGEKDGCAGPGVAPREITFFATKVVYGEK
jgi:hypothetical protein